MARGGKRGNPYRDASGRFASGPGQGGGLGAARKAARSTSGRKSTLQARTSLKKSRAKLAGRDPADQRLSTALSSRAQKGAVTRGNKGLKAAKVASQARISGGRKGVIGKPRGLKPGALMERRKPLTKFTSPGFSPGDYQRRSHRAFYGVRKRNPGIYEKAISIYKNRMDTDKTPDQVKKEVTSGKRYSTVKNKPKPASSRPRISRAEREHRKMLRMIKDGFLDF